MSDDVIIRELTPAEFGPLIREHARAVFAHDHSYRIDDALSETETEQMASLAARMGKPFRLYLGAFDPAGNILGWTWGEQQSKTTFYMVNSAVLAPHRRRGIYTALMRRCIDTVRARGFQLIYSRHNATNNAVIIPKLKAGFVIAKLEVDDRFGVLVHLHLYTNPTRRKVMDYRTGQEAPDAQLKGLFKL